MMGGIARDPRLADKRPDTEGLVCLRLEQLDGWLPPPFADPDRVVRRDAVTVIQREAASHFTNSDEGESPLDHGRGCGSP
jgi:hypothetical protein